MKECLKCGTTMSDNSGDYCEKCKKKDNFIGEEKIINFFSNILMAVGIFSSIIMACTIVVVKEENFFGGLSYSSKEFNPTGFAITIATFISSIIFPLLLKLFIKMSANIRHIANK